MTVIPYDFSSKTLLLMVGLPYSGKSTLALEISKNTGAPIISPDAIRMSLSGMRYLAPLEPTVWWVARMTVRALFLSGHELVILDACHASRKRRDEWRGSEGWQLLHQLVDTSRSDCLSRAQAAGDSEINDSILRMSEAWEPLETDELLWTR